MHGDKRLLGEIRELQFVDHGLFLRVYPINTINKDLLEWNIEFVPNQEYDFGLMKKNFMEKIKIVNGEYVGPHEYTIDLYTCKPKKIDLDELVNRIFHRPKNPHVLCIGEHCYTFSRFSGSGFMIDYTSRSHS